MWNKHAHPEASSTTIAFVSVSELNVLGKKTGRLGWVGIYEVRVGGSVSARKASERRLRTRKRRAL